MSAAFVFLIIVFMLFSLSSQALASIVCAIPAFCALNAGSTIISRILDANPLNGNVGFVGFVGPASINGCILASAFIPLIIKRAWREAILVYIAVVFSRSSIPYGVMFTGVASYYFYHYGVRVYKTAWCWVTLPFLVVMAFLAEKGHLFDSSGRLLAYKTFMAAWWKKGLIFLGSGIGSFPTIGKIIQDTAKLGDPRFIWMEMHSDVLQCLFETGFIGLTIYLLLFIDAARRFYKLRDRGFLFSLYVSICSAMLFDFFVKEFVGAFLFSVLTYVAYRPKVKELISKELWRNTGIW